MQNVWKSGGCTIFYVDEDRCGAIYVISPFLVALTFDDDDDDDYVVGYPTRPDICHFFST